MFGNRLMQLKNDLYIVVSGSVANPEIIDRIKKAKKAGSKVMIIVANMSSPLLKLSDHYVFIKSDSKNTSSKSSIRPMGSLFEFFIWKD